MRSKLSEAHLKANSAYGLESTPKTTLRGFWNARDAGKDAIGYKHKGRELTTVIWPEQSKLQLLIPVLQDVTIIQGQSSVD